MSSMLHRQGLRLALLPLLLLASACQSSGGFPPVADLRMVVEPKPVPGDDIVTDATAEAHYNASVESWGDRLHSAGSRLCRFFKDTNMPGVDFCPAPKSTQ